MPDLLHRRSFVGPLAAVLILATACTANQAGTARSPAANSSPGSSATPQVSNPPPASTSGAGFDATHAAQVLGPSVGLIIASGGGSRGGNAEGSGFAFSSQGGTSYVLTNNHVISGASRVQVVMPDGRHFVAEVQGADQVNDVAVLKVSDGLPVAQFADSTKLQVGQPVVAIGSPLGSQGFGSVTTGVISALHRTLNNVGGGAGGSSESLADVLQTDAAINPGNSGGPLADANGRVVGMNTAGTSNATGIGFAIPSAILQRVAQSLVQGKTPGHPYIGICTQPVEAALATNPNIKGYGVVIVRTLPGTPAEKAGIESGDVIQKVDHTDLNNGQTLGGVLQLHNPGDTVKMTALRQGSTVDLSVTLGDRPPGGTAC
ncbi:MAG TPA: trypsin-like peptidase domain-containing protein [Candidatus Dormibacteraeota bacterium]|nr:trypsin-like peptidase domain-containing protein [Candidatus Dormibacteraeota bacterium]